MHRASLRAALTAGLAGLLFGFDTAVISGVTDSLRSAFGLSPVGIGAAVSAALWGTLVGALVFGSPGDAYGSRNVLRVIALLYVASAIGCALALDLGSFVAFRFIGGLAIGGSSVLAPVYIAEISPADRRGLLVGTFQFNIVLGILIAYLSNYLVGQVADDLTAWRWKLGVTAAPAMLFLLLLFGIPQSPRWLLAHGRRDEALSSLGRLGDPDPERALSALEGQSVAAPADGKAHLSWAQHKRPIMLAITIAMFNQLSGINAILYYLNDIFGAAGFSGVSADLQAIAIGATNLLFTLVGMAVIDRLGRKPLLMIGAAGTAVALAGVAAIFASGAYQGLLIWMLVAFIAFFALSQGAVIWVYLSEIFPTNVRARGQGLGSATHWVMNAIISGLFPVVAARTQAIPFWVFAACMAAQFFVIWRFFPETKRATLESVVA